jgi:hypothetical protein
MYPVEKGVYLFKRSLQSHKICSCMMCPLDRDHCAWWSRKWCLWKCTRICASGTIFSLVRLSSLSAWPWNCLPVYTEYLMSCARSNFQSFFFAYLVYILYHSSIRSRREGRELVYASCALLEIGGLRKGICVEVASGTVLSTQPMLLQPPLETSSKSQRCRAKFRRQLRLRFNK